MDHHKQSTVEQSIMRKITTGEVTPRSRYVFLAEHVGLVIGFLFTVAAASVLCSLLLWYLVSSDSLSYLTFGGAGIPAFFESLPYVLMLEVAVCLLLAALIFRHSDLSYRKPFRFAIFVLVGFVFLGGTALAATNISERVDAFVNADQAQFLRPLIMTEPRIRDRGVTGRVVGVGEGYVTIETPQGAIAIETIAVAGVGSSTLVEGGYVTVVGKNTTDGVFEARKIRMLQQEEAPKIRQRVEEHFGRIDASLLKEKRLIHHEKGFRYCLFACAKEKKEISYCEEVCRTRFALPEGVTGEEKKQIENGTVGQPPLEDAAIRVMLRENTTSPTQKQMLPPPSFRVRQEEKSEININFPL